MRDRDELREWLGGCDLNDLNKYLGDAIYYESLIKFINDLINDNKLNDIFNDLINSKDVDQYIKLFNYLSDLNDEIKSDFWHCLVDDYEEILLAKIDDEEENDRDTIWRRYLDQNF